MVQYRKQIDAHEPNAERVLDGIDALVGSMKKHTWHLEETLIPLALVDPNLPDTERELMAKMLLSQPVPADYSHTEDYDVFCYLDFNQDKPPSLALLCW